MKVVLHNSICNFNEVTDTHFLKRACYENTVEPSVSLSKNFTMMIYFYNCVAKLFVPRVLTKYKTEKDLTYAKTNVKCVVDRSTVSIYFANENKCCFNKLRKGTKHFFALTSILCQLLR